MFSEIAVNGLVSHIDISKVTGKRTDNVGRKIKALNIPFKVVSARVKQYHGWRVRDLIMIKVKDAEMLAESMTYRSISERESGALSAIEQLLNITLERQYSVGKFRLDGYHKESNTVYEIDEEGHFKGGKLRQECIDRQRYIESKLNCKFIRIKV